MDEIISKSLEHTMLSTGEKLQTLLLLSQSL